MVPGDKSLRLNLYIFIACYILLIIMVEPVIDFFLSQGIEFTTPESVRHMNEQKVIISNMVFSVLRMLPMFLVAWLGYRILASARVPPARMKSPFTVPLIQGKTAKMIGILLLTISFLQISQDLVTLAKIMTK